MKKSMTAAAIFTFLSANILMAELPLNVAKESPSQSDMATEMAGQEKPYITIARPRK